MLQTRKGNDEEHALKSQVSEKRNREKGKEKDKQPSHKHQRTNSPEDMRHTHAPRANTFNSNAPQQLLTNRGHLFQLPEEMTTEKFFGLLIAHGAGWKDIKEQCTVLSHTEASERTLQRLVYYRDALDYYHLHQVIHTLFDPKYFQIEAHPDGKVKKLPDGNHIYELKWYNFIIANKTLGRALPERDIQQSPHAIIKISAPGSRTLTSDVDISISVFNGAILAKNEHFPSLLQPGPDFDGRIQVAIIDGFYNMSESEHKVTSGESRDSNIYTDAHLKQDKNDERSGYPNFPSYSDKKSDGKLWDGIDERRFNKLIGKEWVIPNQSQFYEAQKLSKHQLEMAASCVSLRQSLDAEAWKGFMQSIQEDVRKLMQGEDEAVLSKIDEDLKAIQSETKRFCQYHRTCLEKKMAELMVVKQTSTPLQEGAGFERDLEVSAMNALYVEHLKGVVENNGALMKLEETLSTTTTEARRYQKASEEAKQKYTDLEGNPLFKKEIETFKRENAENHTQYLEKCKLLKKQLLKKAELSIQKQEAQIKADLFANEAYISRSAVYHVVKGIQLGEDIAFTRGTVVASALQQIGFRLLHAKEQRDQEHDEGAIAYKNAKYGQRVADVVFGQSEKSYDENVIRTLRKPMCSSTLQVMTSLKCPRLRGDFIFTEEEYHLLNTEIQLVGDVKKKPGLKELQKSAKARELMRKRIHLISNAGNPEAERTEFLRQVQQENLQEIGQEIKEFSEVQEQRLWLSIAAKMVAAGYATRWAVKQRLWGEACKSTQASHEADSVEKTSSSSAASSSTSLASVPRQQMPDDSRQQRGASARGAQGKKGVDVIAMGSRENIPTSVADKSTSSEGRVRAIAMEFAGDEVKSQALNPRQK